MKSAPASGNNPSMMMPSMRSESMAYPSHKASGLISKLRFLSRQHAQKVLFTLAFFVFVLLISSDNVHDGIGLSGGLRKRTHGWVVYGVERSEVIKVISSRKQLDLSFCQF